MHPLKLVLIKHYSERAQSDPKYKSPTSLASDQKKLAAYRAEKENDSKTKTSRSFHFFKNLWVEFYVIETQFRYVQACNMDTHTHARARTHTIHIPSVLSKIGSPEA